jgi:hypothetical protein
MNIGMQIFDMQMIRVISISIHTHCHSQIFLQGFIATKAPGHKEKVAYFSSAHLHVYKSTNVH